MDILTAKLQSANEERETLEQTIQLLTKRLAEAQAERDDANEEKEGLQSRLRRVKDELEALREEKEDAEEQRDSISSKLTTKVYPLSLSPLLLFLLSPLLFPYLQSIGARVCRDELKVYRSVNRDRFPQVPDREVESTVQKGDRKETRS